MRRMNALLGFATACLAAGTLTFTAVADADDSYAVAVTGANVVVTAKAPWHINKDYPWKVVAGDTKIDKTKFSFDEHTASVSGLPKGTAKLKGAVCSGDKCQNFETSVTVQ